MAPNTTTSSSPFDGSNPFNSDPSMPSFFTETDFDFMDGDDYHNNPPTNTSNMFDLAAEPIESVAYGDPKTLLASSRQSGLVNPNEYTHQQHRTSSSSSSSRSSADVNSNSPITARTSIDMTMTDDPLNGIWKAEDTSAAFDHNDPTLHGMLLDGGVDMSHVFDFESASSSPSPHNQSGLSSCSPEMFSNSGAALGSPRVKRIKNGHQKAQSQHSLTRSMNSLRTNSREVSQTNMILSHDSSPAATFTQSPSPDNSLNLFNSLAAGGLNVSTMWGSVTNLQNTTSMPQTRAEPTSIPHGLPNLPPQPAIPSGPPPRLFVQPTPLKSRVETQIPIKLTMHHLPPGIKRIHLPTHTISKPKLLAKPAPTRSPDMLELYTMLVCTSAMNDQAKREKALLRAAAARHDYHLGSKLDHDAEDDDNKPQNGGEVRICPGCITRERKRAGRKKHKKPEEEELWNRFETDRVIVFNTQEIKEWQAVTPHMADPTGAGLRDSVPEGTFQVDAPMRIACYCRHHTEKMGFQVIFTVKDYKDNIVAQQMSSSIMITDDHKTHLPATSTGVPPSGNTLGAPPPSVSTEPKPLDIPPTSFPLNQSSADLANMGPNPAYTYPSGISTAPNSQPPSVSATPVNLSRQGSPALMPSGSMTRKRKASSSSKVPSGLAMTRLEEASQPPMNKPAPGPTESAPVSGAPSPCSPNLGNFQLNADTLFGHYQQSGASTIPQAFATGPPTPNSNAADQFSFSTNRALSLDNIPAQQLFSAPATAAPSRVGSPSNLRETIQNMQNVQRTFHGSSSASQSANPPMIYKIIPGEGPKSGGVEVTILGSGFTHNGMVVMFGDQKAATTTYWGETSLVCLLPPSSTAGIVPVTIRQPTDTTSPTPPPAPTVLPHNRQGLFTYIDDDEHRLIRTALTVLGNKLGGKMTDVADIARNIIYGPNGNGGGSTWGSPTGSGGQGPASNNFSTGPAEQETDVQTGLLRVLEFIDLDDSANKTRINLRLRASGQTMLHLACSLGYDRFVAGLISRGASINVQDKGGFTPLHLAAMNDRPEIVRRLIMKGADPSLRSLSDLNAGDVAQSRDVKNILRQMTKQSRSRSRGSLHSRVSSASSLRSLWDPPSKASHQKSNEFLDDDSDSDESFDEAGSSDDEPAEFEMVRPSRSASLRRPEIMTAGLELDVGPISPTSAAVTAVRDHIQQIQHAMTVHFQSLSQQMPTGFPDYQSYLPPRPAMPRMSSLLPNIRSPAGDSPSVDGKWSLFGSKEAPPPAYSEIFPQKDLDTKQASAAQAAADYEADTKCAALFDQSQGTTEVECAAETVEVDEVLEVSSDLHVGRKRSITREQQETFQRAHAASLKTVSGDKMLWFFWIPILLFIIGTMMMSYAPVLTSIASHVADSATSFTSVAQQFNGQVHQRALNV